MRNTVAPSEKRVHPVANWTRLQEEMDRGGVDLLVAGTPVNVTYVSDFWSVSHWTRRSAQAFALAPRGQSRAVGLVLPLGNADLIPVEPGLAPELVVCYDRFVITGPPDNEGATLQPEEAQLLRRVAERGSDERNAMDALALAVRRLGVENGRIAIEFEGLQHRDAAWLREEFPRAEFVDALPLLRSTRAIKTAEEITRLRRAAQITAESFEVAVRRTSPGDSELDLQRRLQAAMAKRDAVPFLTSITSGPRTALPNGQASERRLSSGDGIRFDGGCRYEHYAADIARIAVVDECSSKHRTYYTAVVHGLEAAVGAARPGATGAQVFEAAVEAVRRSGIPHYRRSHCGHGIGIENYDPPRIAPDSADRLEPGMVICLETPYYELGWGGVQAEDTYLVTESGLEPFTKTPDEPLVAGAG